MFRIARVPEQIQRKLKGNRLICRNKSSTKVKPVEAPRPKVDPLRTQTEIAVLCGNAGLVLMGFTYINQDIFYLRLTAISSLAMSMLSQHKLKQTALFRWNALFMGINAAWIMASFYKESLSDELQQVCILLHERGDMISQEDLKKLFKSAKRDVRNRGDPLMSEGFACKEMCFIESGAATIARKGILLGSLREGDFTGTLDMNARQEDVQEPLQARNDTIESDSTHEDFSMVEPPPIVFMEDGQNNSTETIVVNSESMVVWTWDHEDLKHLDRSIRTGIFAHMHQSSRTQLLLAWSSKLKDNEEKEKFQQVAVDYLFGGIVADGSGENKK